MKISFRLGQNWGSVIRSEVLAFRNLFVQLLRKLEGYPLAAKVDLMNLIFWWKRSESEHIFQTRLGKQFTSPVLNCFGT